MHRVRIFSLRKQLRENICRGADHVHLAGVGESGVLIVQAVRPPCPMCLGSFFHAALPGVWFPGETACFTVAALTPFLANLIPDSSFHGPNSCQIVLSVVRKEDMMEGKIMPRTSSPHRSVSVQQGGFLRT